MNHSVAGVATWHQHGRARPPGTPVEDLGTVSGTYTLLGPDQVPAGATVAFMLSGPARVARYDSTAPYQAEIDTTSMPDGVYQLTVAVLARHSSRARYRLTIANHVSDPVGTVSSSPTPPADPPAPTDTATPPPSSTTPPPTPTTTTSAPATTTTSAPATTTSAPATTTSTSAPTTPASSQAAQVLSLTNAQRTANGCAPLTVDARLTSAAQAHTEDMATNNYFSHDSQDGRSPFDRMTAAGYRFSTAGENIAMGYRTASDVMNGWMNSAGHRANILNCSFTDIGIGYAVATDGSPYWTQDFGRPA